jgi:hypothetical protein
MVICLRINRKDEIELDEWRGREEEKKEMEVVGEGICGCLRQ